MAMRMVNLLSIGVSSAALMASVPAFAQSVGAPAIPAPQQPGTQDVAGPQPAQTGPVASSPTAPAASSETQGLEEIVVTAQKREQSLQDVPVAVTALTQQSLQANRVVNVSDLSGLAPNVVVRPAAGGSQIPSFSARGVSSYGVVPGSDKEFSIYLDGVYLGSPHALFDLPDIARLEVLRGPQGTLFGRNSTAGAVSVITRDPGGKLGMQQAFSFGNLAEFRTRTTIDTPQWGPFSAYFTFVHDEHRGDIKNSGAGVEWDRTGDNTRMGDQTSPRYLGSKNQEQFFAAIKFEPSDSFKTVYKFDYQTLHFTPEGEAPIFFYQPGVIAAFASQLGPVIAPLAAQFFQAAVDANNPTFVTSAKRPDSVNNSWTVAGRQKVYGHNLTSNYQATDNLSFKNIASYRYSFVTSASQLDGLGGLVVPPGSPLGAPGSRLIFTATNAQALDKQWSDEFVGNYNSRLVTLTAGALYFHQKDTSGGPQGIQNTPGFSILPADGRIPLGISGATPSGEGVSKNKATSIAAYGQAEIHATRQLDFVLGGRVTHDKKSGEFNSGGVYVPPAGVVAGDPNYYEDGTLTGVLSQPFTYKNTKFTYSVGANYKPSNDLLFYAKYSTGFVSGGSIAGFGWSPETVKSLEGGVKADLFDRRLRTNLALFHAKYSNIQAAQGGVNIGQPQLGVVVINAGDERAQGFELEITAVPVRGITLGGNLGYTDAKYTRLTPQIVAIYGTGYKPTLIPKWTSNLYAQYLSEPIAGDARLFARIDADYRSKVRFISGSVADAVAVYDPIRNGPSRWLLNTRVEVQNVGPAHLDIAFWTRNLTNNKDTQFPLAFAFPGAAPYVASSSFQQARTYGIDVGVKF